MGDSDGLQLAGATYGYLYAMPVGDAIRELAELGFTSIEIMTTPPHVDSVAVGAAPVDEIRQAVEATGVTIEGLNPTYLDLNVASTNDAFRDFSVEILQQTIDLAAEMGAKRLILAPGRLHPLIAAPLNWLRPKAVDAIRRCVERAEQRDVEVVIENLPSGFIQTGAETAALAEELDSPVCSVVYDVANGFMVEDPADGIAACAERLTYVHLSDTTRQRWEHARIGAGAIDFAPVHQALTDVGYTGLSLLEVVEPGAPSASLTDSAERLSLHGWQPLGS